MNHLGFAYPVGSGENQRHSQFIRLGDDSKHPPSMVRVFNAKTGKLVRTEPATYFTDIKERFGHIKGG